MLSARTVMDRDGIVVSDVRCSHPQGSATEVEQALGHGIVFVRRGCFVRSVDGAAQVLDPTLAYCMNPGEEQRYDHPHGDGDDCTAVMVSPDLAASLWGGDPALPSEIVSISAQLDLRQRLLLAGGDADEHERYESALALVADALALIDDGRVSAGRPAAGGARRALADAAREALTEDPDRSLPELAHAVSTSPHHLSRVFRAEVGHTISRHRMRLRTRAALERLHGGEESLARLAADLGFADQSHLCRVVRGETGHVPSALRRIFSEQRRAPARG